MTDRGDAEIAEDLGADADLAPLPVAVGFGGPLLRQRRNRNAGGAVPQVGERADRLAVELLQATAEIMAAKEMTARLEGEVAALRTGGRAAGSTDSPEQAARRLGHLAATIVEADRKACR